MYRQIDAAADKRILANGTAFITDLGMTGPFDSVLGSAKVRVLSAMITVVPAAFDVATDDERMCGIVVEVDSQTGKAQGIERVTFREPQ